MANAPHSRAFPFAELSSWLTPTAQFFVRSHFGVPQIAASPWTITVRGAVERPRTFTLEELMKLPAQEQVVTLECAGNPVGYGGVSNARWTGARLSALLAACGARADALEVVLVGADGGAEREAGGIHVPAYARAIPLAKAFDPQTLLVYRMNGERLPPLHGGPLRAVVPGYYGMDSVKWVKEIVVGREAFAGFYHTQRYYEARRIGGETYRAALHEMRIKSQIARPAQPLPANAPPVFALAPITITGAAWTNGDAEINRVALSFNGGRSWLDAKLGAERAPFAWRLWSFEFTPPKPDFYEFIVRAYDTKDREQPMTRDATLITPYAQNHSDRRLIEVRAEKQVLRSEE